MKKIYKLALSSTLVVSMVACTNTPKSITKDNPPKDQPSQSFTEFLDDYFVYSITSDFTSLQQLIEHPENYGINRDDIEVSLGKVCTDEEDIKENEEWLDRLYAYDFDELSEKEKVIYEQMEFELSLESKFLNPEFELCGNIWATMSGLQENLISFFSEYTIKNERDIKDLITLIEDVPRYTNDALEFTKKQADAGVLCFDYDEVLNNIQETIDTQETSSIYVELYDEIDHSGLGDEKIKQYKADVKEALDEYFFPSYQKMEDTLISLKDDVNDLTGLANIENGKEYYTLLVQNSTGSSESIEEIEENLQDAIDSSFDSLMNVYNENPLAYLELDYYDTGFESIDDILPFLEKSFTKDFPKASKLDYELNPLNDDQCTHGVVAYCVTDAIDSTKPTQIRYNRRDYGSDTGSLDLYTTLAHEGIPGHMYNNAYVRDTLEHPIQYLLGNIGYQEGYATYVQFTSLNYLNKSDKAILDMYKYNDIYTDMNVALMDIDIHYNGLSLKQFNKKYGETFGTNDLSDLFYQLADNPSSFLSYYYGYLEIMTLKSHARTELGNKFTNMGFNEALLKNGSVNFNIVSQGIEEYIQENK